MKLFLKLLFVTVLSTGFFILNAHAAKKVKLAVFDLVPSNDLKTDLSSLTEIMIAEIDKLGSYSIISKAEIKAIVGFEQQKQLMGCEDDTTCLAEIGGALGVDRLITGSVGKLGKTIIVSIKYINTKTVSVEGRVYENFQGDESLLVDTIKRLVPRLFGIAVKETGLGTLIIQSKQKGARVYLNGNPIGFTPIEPLKLKEGTYNLQLTLEDHTAWAEEVKVAGKKATEVKPTFSTLSNLNKSLAPKKDQSISKSDSGKSKSWYKSWWVWSVVTGVAAGSAALFLTNGDSSPTNSQTGNNNTGGGRDVILHLPDPSN